MNGVSDLQSAIVTAENYAASGQNDQAARVLIRHLSQHPKNSDLVHRIGYYLFQSGDHRQGLELIKRSLDLGSVNVQHHTNYGYFLMAVDRFTDATAAFEVALKLDPKNLIALSGLSHCYSKLKQLDSARVFAERAINEHPDAVESLASMGMFLLGANRIEEGLQVLDRAIDKLHAGNAMDNRRLLSTYLFNLNYSDVRSAASIVDRHRFIGRFYDSFLVHKSVRPNTDSNRPLRIGFISRDFVRHSVAYFLEPLYRHRDRREFEFYSYMSSDGGDDYTDRFKSLSDVFRQVDLASNKELFDRIRADKIDILIDLAGHTSGNRLVVFAMKPAPIQINYIGYPNTVGLSAIDYRIVDSVTDPQDVSEETLVRLPRCFLSYQPPDDAPEVAQPPVLKTKTITFGSFNVYAKISPSVIETWAEILNRVPNSELFVKSFGMNPVISEQFLDDFQSKGISPERIRFAPFAPSAPEHLAQYAEVDIALDTFPYNGTTTTCEALWMGVPVVALKGDRHCARVGASLLKSAGYDEWVTSDRNAYVELAVKLAGEPQGLASTRSTMRENLLQSELCDGAGLTRAFAEAIRDCWRRYCDTRS